MKQAIWSVRANSDIERAIQHYANEDGEALALDFIDAVGRAIAQIERQPGIGSPRYSHELDIPGMRHWRLARFPYAVFYLPGEAWLDVMRLLHLQRDIPSGLAGD